MVQTHRVGGLPPIPKHQEELKIQGGAEYLLANFEVFEIGGSPPYVFTGYHQLSFHKNLELVI